MYVAARIIKALRDKGPTNRTALATAAGLSYDRFTKYLAWLSKKNFVAMNSDGLVALTPAGEEAYQSLVNWIIENVGRMRLSKARYPKD